MHYVVFPFDLIETDWKTAGNCPWEVLNWYSCIFKLTETKAKYQSLWFFLQFECYFLTGARGQKITELLLFSEKFANFKKTDTKVRSILIQRIICVECTLQLFKFTCLSLASFGVLFFHINHIHMAYFPTALVVNIDFMLNWHIVAYKWKWCNY